MKGADTKWSLEAEVNLEGAVNSITCSIDKAELMVGTVSNKVFRVLTNTLDALVFIEGHVSSIMGVAF